MEQDELAILKDLKDDELYVVLQSVFESRKAEWSEATDEYGNPTRAAKLAIIRHVLCA